jgi:hypothetical protein
MCGWVRCAVCGVRCAVCGVRCAVERAGLSGECEWKRSAVGGEDKPIGGEGALYIVRRGEL